MNEFTPVTLDVQTNDLVYFFKQNAINVDISAVEQITDTITGEDLLYNTNTLTDMLDTYRRESTARVRDFNGLRPLIRVTTSRIEVVPVIGQNTLEKPTIMSRVQYDGMVRRFQGGENMDAYIATEILRITSLGSQMEHLSIPPPLLDALNVSVELFGTPLNTTLPRFCSPFPDVERFFGSLGNFLQYTWEADHRYTFNPPYDEQLMETAAERLVQMMKNTPNILVLSLLPVWDPKTQREMGFQEFNTPFRAYDILMESGFIIQQQVLPKDEYPYYNYFTDSYVPASNTHILVMSNTGIIPDEWRLEAVLELWRQYVSM
jgi:hypothetical protein